MTIGSRPQQHGILDDEELLDCELDEEDVDTDEHELLLLDSSSKNSESCSVTPKSGGCVTTRVNTP